MTNWHARVGSKLSTKVSPFLATGAATANAGTTFRMTGSLDFLEERDLGSFAEFIFIHARSLRNPFRIKWKGCTNVPSLFLDRLSRSCIIFEAVRCWKRCEAFSEIQYITEVRGAGAPLVQEKVIDSITALSYILPHLFKAPFQFPQIHLDIVDRQTTL